MSEKLLSIIIVGRNDDYLGNYTYRLQSCLNFLAENLKELGRLNDIEVVLVDWNTQTEETLADVVQISPEAASLLRFVIVPPATANARNPLVSFFTTCAVNVGVRRAKGEFIMLADSDSMMTLPSLKSLLQVLDGELPTPWPRKEIIFPIPRHQIPGSIGARKPSVDQWKKVLVRIFGSRRKESPGADCLGGYSAAQLMHRDIWFELGGYNEKLDRAWGWSDNELMLRVSQKYNWMDLGYYGVAAFHIEHHAINIGEHSRNPDSINVMTLTYESHPSPKNWGLKGIELEEKTISGTNDWRDAQAYNAPMGYSVSTLEALDQAISEKDFEPFFNELRCRYNASQMFDAGKEDAVRAIVSVANLESPLNVYYFGEAENMLLDAILDSAPGAEIYFIQTWPEGDVSERRISPGAMTSHLNFSNHRSFSRILTMPASKAINAIANTDPHAGNMELAIIDRETLGDEFEYAFGQILDTLTHSGAIILIDKEKRAPNQTDDAAIFVGRYLGAYRRRTKGSSPSRLAPFVQVHDEMKIGKEFDVIPMRSGSVHIIRKSPLHTPKLQIAAE